MRLARSDWCVVVNNAGYANVDSIEDVSDEDFRAQVETNFFGVFHVSRAALPLFRAQKSFRADFDDWRTTRITFSTDFDGTKPFEDTALGKMFIRGTP